METPLSTKGNAIYGKGPQKNWGGERDLIKRKSRVGEVRHILVHLLGGAGVSAAWRQSQIKYGLIVNILGLQHPTVERGRK